MNFDYSWASQLEVAGLVTLATLLGGAIGFERETVGRPAGLRTHMLVAGATGLIAGVGRTVFLDAGSSAGDPARALQAAIMGISFLGAGTILNREEEGVVKGLTTAASLFFAAAIGVGTGFGLVPLAIASTLLVVFVLSALRVLERRMGSPESVDEDGAPSPKH